jgi:hypothetical protein
MGQKVQKLAYLLYWSVSGSSEQGILRAAIREDLTLCFADNNCGTVSSSSSASRAEPFPLSSRQSPAVLPVDSLSRWD